MTKFQTLKNGLRTTAVSLLLIATSCARQGFPDGGPKDTFPPKIIACHPENESKDFNARQFIIETDEYIVLKDVANNVIISPPLKQKPDISTKGKGLIVKIKDTLQENTTYLFQFKQAIADYNEGNILESFEYVFGTGKTLDSMMLAGKVVQARNGKPMPETITVMAYKEERFTADSCDTLATNTQPDFTTRCTPDGNFAFHYLPSGNYRLVAVIDKNNNLRIDASESAAWNTSPIATQKNIDSTNIPQLLISSPDIRKQRLLKYEMPEKGKIVITSELPLSDPYIEGVNIAARQLSTKQDTLNIWLSNPQADTARIVVTDSSGIKDTLRLRYRNITGGRGNGRNASKNTAKTLETSLMKSLCSGTSAFYDDLKLGFNIPIAFMKEDAMAEITRKKDSTTFNVPLRLTHDSLIAIIDTQLSSGTDYIVKIKDSIFRDIYGNYADSLEFSLKPKDYGTLTVNIENLCNAQLIIELTDEKDTIVGRRIISAESSKITFKHLVAGNYRLRAIIDSNNDCQWTPGNYRKQIQPEETIPYDKNLQLREKWEMEERWKVTPQAKNN